MEHRILAEGRAFHCPSSAEFRRQQSMEHITVRGRRYDAPIITARTLRLLRRDEATERRLGKDISAVLQTSRPLEESPRPEPAGEPKGPKIHVFDVGQGDMIVVEFAGGVAWFVDAYAWTEAQYGFFKKFLGDQGMHVERLIISHAHFDHIRFAERVVEDYTVAEVVPKGLIHKTTAYRNLLNRCHGKSILRVLSDEVHESKNGVETRILPTAVLRTHLPRETNSRATVVTVGFGRSVAVLAGDVPHGLLFRLLEGRLPDSSTADNRFYKVTHHCSKTGDGDNLLALLAATRCVTSCGRVNRFGHPHRPPSCKLCDHTLTYDADSPTTFELC